MAKKERIGGYILIKVPYAMDEGDKIEIGYKGLLEAIATGKRLVVYGYYQLETETPVSVITIDDDDKLISLQAGKFVFTVEEDNEITVAEVVTQIEKQTVLESALETMTVGDLAEKLEDAGILTIV